MQWDAMEALSSGLIRAEVAKVRFSAAQHLINLNWQGTKLMRSCIAFPYVVYTIYTSYYTENQCHDKRVRLLHSLNYTVTIVAIP